MYENNHIAVSSHVDYLLVIDVELHSVKISLQHIFSNISQKLFL